MFDPPDHKKAELICMDARAFHMLFNQLVVKIKEANQVQEDPWLNTDEAMQLLKISSRTTLKKLCDEGHIIFAKVSPRLTLYERASILAFLEERSKTTDDGKE